MIVITITKSAQKGLNLIICIELFNPFGAVVFHHTNKILFLLLDVCSSFETNSFNSTSLFEGMR